jgi:hypothetical protein
VAAAAAAIRGAPWGLSPVWGATFSPCRASSRGATGASSGRGAPFSAQITDVNNILTASIMT